MSIATTRACACGLRSVWPQSIPAALRSLEYANSPCTFGGPSGRRTALADAARARAASASRSRSTSCLRPRPAPRRRSSGSRCSGRDCRRAPRGSRRPSGSACDRAGRRSRRSGPACRTRTARRRRRRTPPARGAARRSSATPSTVTTSCPSACAARTRHEQTSVPSSSTEHDPHSPCSHAFFEPGRLEPLAQREEQALAAPDVRLARLAVDGQRDLHARHRSSARRVSTRSA